MTDEELIVELRKPWFTNGCELYQLTAADRIEALKADLKSVLDRESATYARHDAKVERLEAALREIAAEASVPVRTWKNGINFKKMYEGWRKIAVERIDIARAALKGDSHE